MSNLQILHILTAKDTLIADDEYQKERNKRMQIVIDIPEELHRVIQEHDDIGVHACAFQLSQIIKNGTPLPKGHGRLGDLDKLYKKFISIEPLYRTKEWIAEAPTIIEADKTESEE